MRGGERELKGESDFVLGDIGHMTNEPKPEPSMTRSILRCVLVVFGVCALYLLCFGPALSLAKRQIIPMRFVLRAYRPLPLSFQQEYLSYWIRIDPSCYRIEYNGPPL